ncbi:YoaK family protein [Clavibacter capsici]|uniref:YoaK family protein n=1 Tax=Clavibacter capsici TaxID=1874630 RepID=UPI00287BBD91|nr:YoaK family protein [Clavibacter capsici]
MPRDRPHGAYIAALLVLTAATGAIDGVSYLALDRVFTGNMTGNVIFIGFGLVGVAGVPVLNNVVALLAFMAGAVLAARITCRAPTDLRLPRSAVGILVTGTVATFALAGSGSRSARSTRA